MLHPQFVTITFVHNLYVDGFILTERSCRYSPEKSYRLNKLSLSSNPLSNKRQVLLAFNLIQLPTNPCFFIVLSPCIVISQGFFIGQWRLEGTTVYITSLTDPTGLTLTSSRYTFQMTLDLRSRPSLGRWNRLDMKAYDSVNIETGEATAVSLKHDRPFWFSKVRSYS